MKRLLSYHNFLLIIITDIILLSISCYAAFMLRFNFNIPDDFTGLVYRTVPMAVIIKLITFYFFDLYRGMWRYTSTNDLMNVIKASVISSLLLITLLVYTHGFSGFARSTLVIDLVLTILLISGSRVSIRLYFDVMGRKDSADGNLLKSFTLKRNKGAKKILIIGAGDAGEKIFREIRGNPGLNYRVMGFIDDDPAKWNKLIHNTTVLGEASELKTFVERLKIEEIIIALPSATSEQMRRIVTHCKETGISFKTLPSLGELIDGRISVKSIRDVAYRDLLGREAVRLDEKRIGGYIQNARVLVTGAGGSIGSELCRQICRFRPEMIVLCERAESPLYEIELELKKNFPSIRIIPALADVRDRNRLSDIFKKTQPHVVFHAAAYKHVPMLEIQPWEAITNNVVGTRNIVEICKQFKVDRFVLVSTDKAVRPTNVMGASKRVCELLVQGENSCGEDKPRLMIVRFGNVVGSVGSVVPLFKKQIETGGPVTITHPDVTRYFMMIPEACQLILQTGAMGKGGETFILDMGTPVKIVDMAKDLIRLSGFEPEVDIPIEYIGLRPGEKLYEELITEGEGILPTTHEKIMVLSGASCDLNELNSEIKSIVQLAQSQDAEGIRSQLKKIIPEYRPASNGVMSEQ